jgi:hypothetical protein
VDLEQTSDGGYIVGGYSFSGISGDKTESYIYGSFGDLWIIKLDTSGNILWQNTIGGNWADYLASITQTYDGGYILSAQSRSDASGDKSEGIIGFAYYYTNRVDYWIIKLDSTGYIEWEQTMGGDSAEVPYQIIQTNELDYLCLGYSNSSNYDKTEPRFGLYYDYWLVKIDSIGNILWDKTLGGYENDLGKSVALSSTGNIIVAGFSNSDSSGNKTEDCIDRAVGGGVNPNDFWIVKLQCENEILLFADADGDNFGNASIDTTTCLEEIVGYTPDNTDCDDANPSIYPGAPEILDGLDNNCSGEIDEGLVNINSIESDYSFIIYPNPVYSFGAQNIFTIQLQLNNSINSFAEIKILNGIGKEVFNMQSRISNSQLLETIYLQNTTSSGIYLIKIITENAEYSKQLFINQ